LSDSVLFNDAVNCFDTTSVVVEWVSVGRWWNGTGRWKPKFLECLSYMDWSGIEAGCPRWEGDERAACIRRVPMCVTFTFHL